MIDNLEMLAQADIPPERVLLTLDQTRMLSESALEHARVFHKHMVKLDLSASVMRVPLPRSFIYAMIQLRHAFTNARTEFGEVFLGEAEHHLSADPNGEVHHEILNNVTED